MIRNLNRLVPGVAQVAKISLPFVLLSIALILVIGIPAIYLFTNDSEKITGFRHAQVGIKDYDTGRFIKTGYIIYFPDLDIVNEVGVTSDKGYVRTQILIPINQSFHVLNTNLENQTYYTRRSQAGQTDRFGNVTANIRIFNYGTVEVQQEGDLGSDNPINLTLFNTGEFRFAGFCLRWSPRITRVDVPQLEFTSKLQRFGDRVDKCWSSSDRFLKLNGDNQNKTFSITYNALEELKETDYIRVYVIDSDFLEQSSKKEDINSYLVELDDKDVGQEDIIYEIVKN